MIRTLIRIVLTLVGNALGLWIASLALDKMSISGAAFVLAVVIFTVLEVILHPLITKLASKKAEALQGGSALVTTFIALLITTLLSDGLDISGVVTWILATVIVWFAAMIAGILLPMLFLKNVADDHKK